MLFSLYIFFDAFCADDLSSISSRSLSRSPEREFDNIDGLFPMPKFLNVEIVPPKRPTNLIHLMGAPRRTHKLSANTLRLLRRRTSSNGTSLRTAPKRVIPVAEVTAPLTTNANLTRTSSCSSLSRMSNSVSISISSQPDSYNDLSGYTEAQIKSKSGSTDPLASLAATEPNASDGMMTSGSLQPAVAVPLDALAAATNGALLDLSVGLPVSGDHAHLSLAGSHHHPQPSSHLEESMRDVNALSPSSYLPQSSSMSSLSDWAASTSAKGGSPPPSRGRRFLSNDDMTPTARFTTAVSEDIPMFDPDAVRCAVVLSFISFVFFHAFTGPSAKKKAKSVDIKL